VPALQSCHPAVDLRQLAHFASRRFTLADNVFKLTVNIHQVNDRLI
jgi:hypothetical protein